MDIRISNIDIRLMFKYCGKTVLVGIVCVNVALGNRAISRRWSYFPEKANFTEIWKNRHNSRNKTINEKDLTNFHEIRCCMKHIPPQYGFSGITQMTRNFIRTLGSCWLMKLSLKIWRPSCW